MALVGHDCCAPEALPKQLVVAALALAARLAASTCQCSHHCKSRGGRETSTQTSRYVARRCGSTAGAAEIARSAIAADRQHVSRDHWYSSSSRSLRWYDTCVGMTQMTYIRLSVFGFLFQACRCVRVFSLANHPPRARECAAGLDNAHGSPWAQPVGREREQVRHGSPRRTAARVECSNVPVCLLLISQARDSHISSDGSTKTKTKTPCATSNTYSPFGHARSPLSSRLTPVVGHLRSTTRANTESRPAVPCESIDSRHAFAMRCTLSFVATSTSPWLLAYPCHSSRTRAARRSAHTGTPSVTLASAHPRHHRILRPQQCLCSLRAVSTPSQPRW